MTAGTPTGPIKNLFASRSLKSAEWMAENAYIAPGFHRLLTAGGLTIGLWGGRRFMDIITARDAVTGEEIPEKQAPEIVRPIHGIMRYNPYSDTAADRWKFVVDRMTPMVFGAAAAYWGGKTFFHGKIPGKEAFSPGSAKVLEAIKGGKFSTETTDAGLRLAHSDATRKWAAATFVEGSAAGMHLPGALSPFNNGMIAVSFQQGAGRNISFPFMPKLNKWLGNHGGSSRFMYTAMRDTAKWMESNISTFESPDRWATEEALLRRAKDALQKFPDRTVEQEQKMVSALKGMIDEGYTKARMFRSSNPSATEKQVSSHVYDFVTGKQDPKHGLLGQSFDHFLNKNGFKLSEAKIAGDPWAFFSRLFGSRQQEEVLVKSYGKYIKETFEPGLNVEQWTKDQLHMEPWKVAAAYGGGAAAITAALVGSGAAVSHINKKSDHAHQPHLWNRRSHSPAYHAEHHLPMPQSNPEADSTPQPSATATRIVTPATPATAGNLVDWVNGKPLDVAHWVSRVVITPPSMHRFMNAAYLSAVLYGGMRVANILTGRKLAKLTAGTLAESEIAVKDVWAPLRPLHGLLAYTPGSAAIQDRWRQAAHYIMPVGVGMFGTYAGSYMYFKDRIKALDKPDTLEDYADRIAMEQSKFYAGATAITSIFNTGSGIHLLPFFNYSANMHNRYLLGSGQQIALPGLGKWWSGNAGTTPWGVKRTLQFMENYLTYNPAARPEELPALVHSLLGKLYPTLSESDLLDKKQRFIDRIHDVRDSYLVENVVPPLKRHALSDAMKKMLEGTGFEMTLRDAGLDPAQANLASNGASGAIANFFGQQKDVTNLTAEYRQKFTERLAKEPVFPRNYLQSLIDKPSADAANDNGHAATQTPAIKGFATRISAEPKRYPILG